ncbi:MAG TPA: HEAT repeat domain-containing protein [Tepidisphaeraceae bacterium]|nr:HEAT repeat domain-containing protein [Tepidisphaeraceae bacterium]
MQLPHSAYICGRGDLWITHPDAPETPAVLQKAYDQQTHLVRETIEFIWWRRDDDGRFNPWIATRTAAGYEWITPTKRLPMPTDATLDWRRAIFWTDDAIIVPTATGVAIVRMTPEPVVEAITLLAPSAETTPLQRPQFATDGQGVLAWVPASGDVAPGTGVARYIDGKWSMLDESAWPASVVQLVPLIDGSVLRITTDGAKMTLSLVPLSANAVDEARVTALVEQLSEPDPRTRAAAFTELTRFGPGAWPVLERLRDEQPPEARLRIGQLLRDRAEPSLGGMTVVDGEMRVVSRDRTGGVVFYSDKGVSVPNAAGGSDVVSPAWISVRPGRAPELLPEAMIADLRPDRHVPEAYNNDWLVTDSVNGPRRYIGRRLTPLLRKDEREFDRLIGIDARGRWVFGRSTANNSATRPADAGALIIDPTLPDPTPRLPGWTIANTRAAGWTKEGWPAVDVDGKHYSLHERSWQRLDLKKDPLTVIQPPSPTTAPAPLTTKGETSYFDGVTAITVRTAKGAETSLPLPAEAQGTPPAYLAAVNDDVLMLMNTPGRIVRLKRTPAATAESSPTLEVGGIFTRKVPNGTIRRFWIDPAGRLCVAHDEAALTVFFPAGVIPPPIRRMMPIDELVDEE